MQSISEFEISLLLKQQGISEARKEGKTILIIYKENPIRFDIQKSWSRTIQGFELAAKNYITDKKLVQAIILDLNRNYLKICGLNNTGNTLEQQENDPSNVLNKDEQKLVLEDLETSIPDRDYAEFVIKTARRTVKQENSLVRQIFYSGISAYTNDPINLGIIAPTSEGKTYPVIEVINFFPREDVWYIGSMSPKVLIRQKGTLVDSNNEPLDPKIKELKRLIAETEDTTEEEDLKDQLRILFENSKTLIDLTSKVILFLEPPHSELWNLLKPILSHDSPEIEFPYVDKNDREGIVTKKVIVRGWPACIFCSAKDESSWPTWPEIVSRFLISSPNMIAEKYQQSNVLIAQRKSLPSFVQQQLIVSDEQVKLAKRCVIYLKQEIQNHNKTIQKNNCIWIPYGQLLSEVLPAERGTDTRATKRIFSLLNIIPLVKAHLRPRLTIKEETNIVATLNDLSEVLSITQNLNGIPIYKMKFLKEIFFDLYKSKVEPSQNADGSKEENIIAVTTKELCEAYKTKTGKSLNSDNLKKTFLRELLNNGWIEEEDSLIDKRQKIYYPLIEPEADREKIANYRNSEELDNLL